jgi:WXG100 family type VII secretion target
MAGSTNIDDATLHAAANDCRSAMELVTGEAKKVAASKQEVAATWQGAASMTFQRVLDEWDAQAGKLLGALSDISDLLDRTGTNARANEEQQDQMFNQFNAAING